jgi:hypothetical protein
MLEFSIMGRNSDSDKIVKRLTINLPESLCERLEKDVQIEGISQAEAARNAIKRDAFLKDKRAEGCDVILKTPDGDEYLLFP